ncbi:MAG: hypothetical protein Q8L14_36660 [Myxococcales bacterium]|nr:hypothetical protein [Myxococcales bacterium]
MKKFGMAAPEVGRHQRGRDAMIDSGININRGAERNGQPHGGRVTEALPNPDALLVLGWRHEHERHRR